MPSREEARLLQVSERAPVLELARVSTAASGQVVEVTICVIPADRVELHAKLSRASSAAWREL
jgi:GntR family transcriptional regulator